MAKSLNLHQKSYNLILTAVGLFFSHINNIALKSEIYVVFMFMYMQSFEMFLNLGFVFMSNIPGQYWISLNK